jgi:hypothetical protein
MIEFLDGKAIMNEEVISKHGCCIRLTAERWMHITEEHCELAGMREEVLETISDPMKIVAGNQGELIAIRGIGEGKFLVVPYREREGDGFIITAFLTRRVGSLDRRIQIWPL